MKRVAILCPGRGSYTEKSLGSLPRDHAWVRRADELRAERGLSSLAELDGARKFEPERHLAPADVSPMIWLVSMLDAAAAAPEYRVVCVAGNSMGWYTALSVAGALDFDDGFRLVQEMSMLQHKQQKSEGGGQIIFPVIDESWRGDSKLETAVEEALVSSNGEAMSSIRLGGYAVLAGTEAGIAHLMKSLPRVKLGQNLYPFRLMQHGAYHTPLVEGVAEEARRRLADLRFTAPKVTLVDGRGGRFTPWSTDPAELAAYTLGQQVSSPFDFTSSVRVALREHAPDRLVCPGPGNSLGGVCGQILVEEGWRGIRSREDFDRVQASEEPILVSMRR
ncbi:MAG: ACP S-malonyltransferase [Planctomycetota bacterium]